MSVPSPGPAAVFTHVYQVKSAGKALRSCCIPGSVSLAEASVPKVSLAIAGSHLELAAAQQQWELNEL